MLKRYYQVVFTTTEIGDDKEFLAVNYGNTVGLLVEAIKELKGDLENHKKHCTCGAN